MISAMRIASSIPLAETLLPGLIQEASGHGNIGNGFGGDCRGLDIPEAVCIPDWS